MADAYYKHAELLGIWPAFEHLLLAFSHQIPRGVGIRNLNVLHFPPPEKQTDDLMWGFEYLSPCLKWNLAEHKEAMCVRQREWVLSRLIYSFFWNDSHYIKVGQSTSLAVILPGLSQVKVELLGRFAIVVFCPIEKWLLNWKTIIWQSLREGSCTAGHSNMHSVPKYFT